MRTLSNILIGVAPICYVLAITSKFTNGFLLTIGIKPLTAFIFGSGCLLLSLTIDIFKK